MAGKKLSDICSDFFSFVVRLKNTDDFGDGEALRHRLKRQLELLKRRGRDAGIDSEDIEAAQKALVALVDETILNSNWREREAWSNNPLALELFKTRDLGDEFFDQLEKLRPASTAAEKAVLEIYYLGLGLGYEGKYALYPDKAPLKQLAQEVHEELAAGTASKPLSPHAGRSEDLIQTAGAIPTWVVLAVCFSVAVMLWAGTKWWVNSSASDLVEKIDNVLHPGSEVAEAKE